MSVSLLCQNVVTSASLSARHSIVVTGTRVVKQPGLSHRGGRGKHIVIRPRAGFLDNLLGVNNGNDGDKKVTRPKPGTKTVLMCSCCSNKGFEKCPGCNGTGKVRASFVVLRQDFHFHKKHLSSDAAHTAVTDASGNIATATTPASLAEVQEAIPGLPNHLVVADILRSEHFDDPADLARLPAVSRAMRDAVAETGLRFEELDETRAVDLGCLSAVQRLQRGGRLSRQEYLCAAAARSGQLEELKVLRADGCPWDEKTCAEAARSGHLEVLQ